MRGDQDGYDPNHDRCVEHDARDDGAGLVVWVVFAACVTLGFALGIMAGRTLIG